VKNPVITIRRMACEAMDRAGLQLGLSPYARTRLQACADHGVGVEINANPHRLDLDWRWHRRAIELGCMLSINPDAHSIDARMQDKQACLALAAMKRGVGKGGSAWSACGRNSGRNADVFRRPRTSAFDRYR